MRRSLELIFDSNPTEGCGCNCGCGGASKVEEMNQLIDDLQKYNFDVEMKVDASPISDYDSKSLISKLNIILEKTEAAFRVDEDNLEEALDNILPLVVLDGRIITAYGIPPLQDILVKVRDSA